MKTALCFISGSGSDWTAHCVDFDIAIDATSFDEAKRLIEYAVTTYVKDAMAEDVATRKRLLSRRAPWWVRFSYLAKLVFFGLTRSQTDRSARAEIAVPCPA